MNSLPQPKEERDSVLLACPFDEDEQSVFFWRSIWDSDLCGERINVDQCLALAQSHWVNTLYGEGTDFQPIFLTPILKNLAKKKFPNAKTVDISLRTEVYRTFVESLFVRWAGDYIAECEMRSSGFIMGLVKNCVSLAMLHLDTSPMRFYLKLD